MPIRTTFATVLVATEKCLLSPDFSSVCIFLKSSWSKVLSCLLQQNVCCKLPATNNDACWACHMFGKKQIQQQQQQQQNWALKGYPLLSDPREWKSCVISYANVYTLRFCYKLLWLLVKMRCIHVLIVSLLRVPGCVQSCGLWSGQRHGPMPRMWPSPSRLWSVRWATTWSGLSGAPLHPGRRRASWSWGRNGSCRNWRVWITRRCWVWKRSWSSRPGRRWTGTDLRRANAALMQETRFPPDWESRGGPIGANTCPSSPARHQV